MLVSSGKRAGRSHRDRRVPCQDAFAVHSSPDGQRVVAAVADGLGSRPLSHVGSEAAARAATRTLAGTRAWGPRALHRAFAVARGAVESHAAGLGVAPGDLATTLHVVTIADGEAHAASVGDGTILCAAPEARILLGPADSEYANEVLPLTDPRWRDHFRMASASDARRVILFTDGLNRLLLHRQGRAWAPFRPFFEAFLPRLEPARFDALLVRRFLDSDAVDAAWDDDKCLVVIGPGAAAP